MKTTRKILSMLLVISMVAALFVTGVYAEGEGDTAVKYEHNTTGIYTGMPENAIDDSVKYLSDMDFAAKIGGGVVTGDATYNHSTGGLYVYVAADNNSRWVVKNQTYDKLDENGNKIPDPTDNTKNVQTEKGYRDFFVNGKVVTYKYDQIALGGLGVTFDKGISVCAENDATKENRAVIYDAAGFDRFYSVVGGTGDASTRPNPDNKGVETSFYLDYEIWGSKDETWSTDAKFEKLAYAEKVYQWHTIEFDVDISEYNYIKLLVKKSEGAQSGSTYYVSWGNACFYNLPDYTVTYDGNGGVTADNAATFSDTENAVNADQASHSITIDDTMFTRPGYTFTGWSTTADGAVDQNYDPNTKIDMAQPTAITLYAQWDANELDYTVKYQTLKDGVYTTINAPEGMPTAGKADCDSVVDKTNLPIATTQISIDGSDYQLVDNYTLTISATGENVLLVTYACAAPTDYEVIYNANDGSETPATKTDEESGNFTSVTHGVTIDENTFTKENYSFIGWNTKADGTGETVTGTITLGSDAPSLTLYAQWQENPKWDYSVKYDANDGSETPEVKTDEESRTAYTDTLSITADADTTFAKPGHTFAGWNTEKDGSGTAYAAGAAIALDDENNAVTLYAQWTINTHAYTVKYMVRINNGEYSEFDGKLPSGAPTGETVNWGTTVDQLYLATNGLPATLSKGTITYIRNNVDSVLIDGDNKVVKVYYTFVAEARDPEKLSPIGKDDSYKGIPKSGKNVTYLSDLYDTDAKKDHWIVGSSAAPAICRDFSLDKNFFGTRVYVYTSAEARWEVKSGRADLVDDCRTLENGIAYHIADIVLGHSGTKFEKGLGFQPSTENAEDCYIIYEVGDMDVNTFYAVAGITGEGNNPEYTDRIFTFEVWGSRSSEYDKDMPFEKLAYVEGIRAYLTGEFNVDISGYNYIKLVCVTNGVTTSAECAWGNAALYKREIKVDIDNDINSDTSDSFSILPVVLVLLSATAGAVLVINRKRMF